MLRDLLRKARILPVLTVHRPDQAVRLVNALMQGGLQAAEITLRTEHALACLTAVREAFPQLILAAGTVTDIESLEAVNAIGVNFAVSPGLSEQMVRQAKIIELPLLPGVATPSEVMRGMELGIQCFKLFPAEAVGGRGLLKALAEPLPKALFCPTGGVNAANYREYLQLPNVVCVGGSWIAPKERVEAGDWPAITLLAREALESS